MTLPVLSPLEARVLGVLIEKQRSVPDSYPMSLNALIAGCNQKTSRAPIMNVTEAEVLQALDALNGRSLIVETSGGRVMRYAHNGERVLGLPAQSVALLATLILRGPQTAGELRTNSERLHRFADISAVEGFLHELAERTSGALVAELPRMPGTRETRWMQLLTGPAPASTDRSDPRPAGDAAVPTPDIAALAARLDALSYDVEALKATVAELRAERLNDSSRAE
jgi:uncharacterized protein YceH (UPF0502 family)